MCQEIFVLFPIGKNWQNKTYIDVIYSLNEQIIHDLHMNLCNDLHYANTKEIVKIFYFLNETTLLINLYYGGLVHSMDVHKLNYTLKLKHHTTAKGQTFHWNYYLIHLND